MRRSLANLKLQQVRYFLSVAELQNFTRAADKLGATQPTVSHQVAELESILGVQLFSRNGKTIRLTEAGSLFQTFATRAVRQLESGLLALSEIEDLMRGSLRLGVIQSLTRTILPPVFTAFASRHPMIDVSITEKTAGEIENGLSAGHFDLGLAFAPAINEDTEVEPVLQEEILLVVDKDHHLAGIPVLELSRLSGLRMILLDRSFSTRRLIDQYFDKANVQPDVVCSTNSMSFMLAAAGQHGATTMVPERGFDQAMHPNLRSVRLRDPTPVRTSALLWPRFGLKTVAARAFSELVKKHFQQYRVY